MKKIISVICGLLAAIMLFGCIGCIKADVRDDPEPVVTNEPHPETEAPATVVPTVTQEGNLVGNYYADFNGFLKGLDSYKEDNFIASPTSLRAALCLAIAGAEGDTLAELLRAAGFSSKEEAYEWYNNMLAMISAFAEDLESDRQREAEQAAWFGEEIPGSGVDRAFEIANSIWNNSGVSQGFKDSYIECVKNVFGADAFSEDSKEITGKINSWVNEKTHGMIPQIVGDVSKMSAVLVNALYLRTTWTNDFGEHLTHEDKFTCFDGSETKKEFMEQERALYRYYEDENTRFVILPMDGNISFVCVLGDTSDLENKIKSAEYRDIHLVLPKMEIESSFDNSEMVNFVIGRGAKVPFTGDANFNSMCVSEDWYINDIIQKAKIKTDEEGIEASAATAILMEATAAFDPTTPPPVIDFIADHPFSFFIYCDINSDAPEMLFCGQMVK